ncbi:MAG: PorT family protein [Bacteroidales bacterium]|nr:PorT family protein [Bacteroidales bacterium]
MLVGYNVGGFVNYSMEDILSGGIADIMSVQAELSIQTKGTTLDFPSVDENFQPTTISVDQVFTYVQVPILAKFTFETNGDLKYFGEGGFFMGSLFGLTIDGETSWDHDADPTSDPRKYREEYSGFDFGIVVGGGVHYALPFGGRSKPWEAIADVRYSLGLNSIGDPKDKTPEILKESLEDIKTNTISILLGVAYSF